MSTTTLRIEPGGVELPVAAGRSLLEAARDAGLRPPSLCRNGSCRECMAQLLEGQVRYRIDWPGLSAQEKAEGWVLPCVALPLGDVVLRWPGAAQRVPESPDRAAPAPPP